MASPPSMMTNVFSPMGINIGNRMAESFYQFSATFLHHDKPSMHDYS
ncbi:hypothetical protein [Klebsiella pneumoniae IS39]|nr:hypothetical protein [Klebsiella pneumoniae IS39]